MKKVIFILIMLTMTVGLSAQDMCSVQGVPAYTVDKCSVNGVPAITVDKCSVRGIPAITNDKCSVGGVPAFANDKSSSSSGNYLWIQMPGWHNAYGFINFWLQLPARIFNF